MTCTGELRYSSRFETFRMGTSLRLSLECRRWVSLQRSAQRKDAPHSGLDKVPVSTGQDAYGVWEMPEKF